MAVCGNFFVVEIFKWKPYTKLSFEFSCGTLLLYCSRSPQARGSKTSIWTSYKMSHARVINLGYLFINFNHIKEKTRCFVCLVTPILCSPPKSSGRPVFHAPSHHRGHRGPGARGDCSVKDIFPEINQIAYFGTIIGDISVYRT